MNFGNNNNYTGMGQNTNPLSRFTSGLTSPYGSSSSSPYTSSQSIGSNDFMQSNSLITKIGFLFLVLFGFIVLLRIGIAILGYFYGPKSSPELIDGMVDASQLMIIEQDPNTPGSNTITRSVNASDGIEFTWSVWIFINNLNDNSDQYRCVFYKGNNNVNREGHNTPNNAPGLYIAPNTNDLVVFMNTFNVINEKITVSNIPLNKWINVIIRCKNTTLDVYINGTITKSQELHGVPKQNYGNVYIGQNNGFSGYISNLRYYDYAIGTTDMQQMVVKGANTKMVGGSSSATIKTPDYLSLRWFFFGANDGFNP